MTSQTIKIFHLEARLLATASVLYCNYIVLYTRRALDLNCSNVQPLRTLFQHLKGEEQVQNCKAWKIRRRIDIQKLLLCYSGGKGVWVFWCNSTASGAFHNNDHKIPQQTCCLKTTCVGSEAPLLNESYQNHRWVVRGFERLEHWNSDWPVSTHPNRRTMKRHLPLKSKENKK